MHDEQIKHMVERFLQWKLPDSFCPDGGIRFDPVYANGTNEGGRHKPVGTNLLTATQAEEMVRHILDGMPDAPASVDALKVEDGDVLVIKTERPITNDTFERLKARGEALLDKLGKKAVVLVLSDGIEAGLLKTSKLPDLPTPGLTTVTIQLGHALESPGAAADIAQYHVDSIPDENAVVRVTSTNGASAVACKGEAGLAAVGGQQVAA